MALAKSEKNDDPNSKLYEINQRPKDDLEKPRPYSRQYLEPLSKSALIDVIMKLQEEKAALEKKLEMKEEADAAVASGSKPKKPEIPKNLLASLTKAKKKRKKKKFETTVRTRDGKLSP